MESLCFIAYLIILVATLGVSAVHRFQARSSKPGITRRSESAQMQILRFLGTLPVLIVLLGTLFSPDTFRIVPVQLPDWLRMVGILLGVLGALALLSVFRAIGSNVSETVLTKPNHELVKHGPYRLVRHPLYTFGLIQLLALGVISSNVFLIAAAVLGTVIFRIGVIPKEEKHLIETFGEDYLEYQRSTWAMIPWIT